MENSKNKIAVCIFGQTRTYKVFTNLYKNLNDQSDFSFDFFLTTWDDFKPNNKLDFFTETEYIKTDIFEFKNHTERAAYCIARVNQLKLKHELQGNFVYDYVVLARGEIEINKEDLLSTLRDKCNNSSQYEINILSDIGVDKTGAWYQPSDFFSLGTSLAYDRYANSWKSYYRLEDGIDDKHGGHNFHAYAIKHNNLESKKVKIKHRFEFNQLKKREV